MSFRRDFKIKTTESFRLEKWRGHAEEVKEEAEKRRKKVMTTHLQHQQTPLQNRTVHQSHGFYQILSLETKN